MEIVIINTGFRPVSNRTTIISLLEFLGTTFYSDVMYINGVRIYKIKYLSNVYKISNKYFVLNVFMY